MNIKCQEFRDTVSDAEYRVVEEELRSALLKLMMIDGHVPKIPTGNSYPSYFPNTIYQIEIIDRLQLEDHGCHQAISK